MVRLVRLIEMLAVEAIRSGNERVDQSSLLNIPTAPLLSMTECVDAAAYVNGR